MDPRVREAITEKIEEAISNPSEIGAIMAKLNNMAVSNREDFAFGIAIGRIYNSFHYQTRRILKRNATAEEFREFLDVLGQKSGAIRNAFQQR